MVATHNLTVYQGSDFRRALELRNESATLIDLTGYTFRGQVRTKYTDASPVFSFEFTLRDQETDTGIVDLLLAADSTAVISIDKKTNYLYDIEMVTAEGAVRRIVGGKLELIPEVTK